MHTTRRAALGALAGVGTMPIWAGLAKRAGGQEAGALIFGSSGGAFEETLRRTIFDPFAEATGIDVTVVSSSSGERWASVSAMAQAGYMDWDMMQTGGAQDLEVPERRDLLMPVGDDCSLVPRAQSDGIGACHPLGVVPAYSAMLLAANNDHFGDHLPTGWVDFFDVENFPGPRGLPDYGDHWPVYAGALLADGVDRSELFPLDLDRAFRKLEQIRPHVGVWWGSGSQFQQAMRDGEIVFGLGWLTRISPLEQEGMNLTRIWDGSVPDLTHWVVFRDAPHADNALRFLNWYFDNPQAQAEFCRAFGISPSTQSALDLFTPEEQRQLPTYPDNWAEVIQPDWRSLGENTAQMIERWNYWISR